MELSKLHKNVKIRMLDVFVNSLSSSMYLPFMAIYFASRFGLKLTGILMILTVSISFVAGLYAGYFSDLAGRKKIMLGAATARSIGVLLMIVANLPVLESTVVTFIAILIISAAGGITEPVAEAMVIDVTTAENRKPVYNFMYWFSNLSVVIGSVIGGFLFTTHLLMILVISLVLSFVSVLLIFVIKDTYKPIREAGVKTSWDVLKAIGSHYRSVSMNKTFMLFTLATLLFFTLEYQTSNYIAVRLADELHLQRLFSIGSFEINVDGTRMLGLLNAENTVIVVSATLLVGKLMQRFNGLHVLVAGIMIYTLGYFVLGFSNAPWLLLGAGLIATIGEIMFWPVRQAYLADLIPENARSSYLAVNSLAFRGSSIVASLFITLGAFASSLIISFSYIVIGLLSIWLFHVSISRSVKTDMDSRK